MRWFSVRFKKLRDEIFCGASNVVDWMVHTVLVYPTCNLFGISFLSDVRRSSTIRVVGSQKSIDPTKDKGIPPNRIRIANLPRLSPQIALKIADAQFHIFPSFVGKRLNYVGPDQNREDHKH